MSIFSDIKALVDVQRIKSGGTAKLSISQIVNLNINLPDAQKSLSTADFSEIHALYKEFRKCTTKIPMDASSYFSTTIKVIEEFDKIAPYEEYCGGNALEISFMFSDIYGQKHHEIRKLRRDIRKLEIRIREHDAALADNTNALRNSYSDDQLARLIAMGQFSESQAEEYRQARDSLEMYILSAPSIRESLLVMIQDAETQIANLKRES